MTINPAHLSRTFAKAVPTSFFVLGEGEAAHWISLTLMVALRKQGLSVTALLPFAPDAVWEGGRWRSKQVSRLQAASSFEFPTSAMCTAPMPELGAPPAMAMQPEAVVDSYAALATWVDVVVIDAEGGLVDPSLELGALLRDLVQILALPIIGVLEEGDTGFHTARHPIARCRERGMQVVGCVGVGQPPSIPGLDIPLLGTIPVEVLRDPLVASAHIDVGRLLNLLSGQA